MISLRAEDLWVILTAVLTNIACGTLGCFLVLRRMSLLGDAISHAILPGLALAFIVSGSRATIPMLIGAMILGVLTSFFSASLNRWGKVPEDAAMGVVFTSLFALGVVLISVVASDVDLDPGCVLYGLIEFVPLDTVPIFGAEIPRATLVLGIVCAMVLALVALFFKELRIVSFDPALATTMGINATLVHYGLMAAVAGTAVASFEAVGSILVVAMLIAPGATAHLLTDRLNRTVLLAMVLGTTAAIFGYLLALYWNTSVAGMISVVAMGQFFLALFFAPQHGWISRKLTQLRLRIRILSEDILGILYRLIEAGRRSVSRKDLAAALGGGAFYQIVLWFLQRRGVVASHPGGELSLTELGSSRARGLVRSHRLWESYLSKHFGLPLDHLHAPAERMEHFVSSKLEQELAVDTATQTDPHGKDIP